MPRPVAGATSKECPLCNRVVAGGVDGMNRHFETECTWRHNKPSPGAAGKGARPPKRARSPGDGT